MVSVNISGYKLGGPAQRSVDQGGDQGGDQGVDQGVDQRAIVLAVANVGCCTQEGGTDAEESC